MGTVRRITKVTKPKTGICMFAYNNKELDYTKLAIIAGLHIKENMKNNNIALICDAATEDYLNNAFNGKIVNHVFKYIIVKDVVYESNIRVHHDSPWHTFKIQFTNQNKHEIFDISPFEKTLLIDTDFLICNSEFDLMFETDVPLSLYNKALDLKLQMPLPNEQRLQVNGIDMWWSTVLYFDKSDFSKTFFDLWAHVRNNYDFYRFRYGFPGHLYRTDYAVSIAIHILNGMMDNDNLIQTLPGSFMRYMDQKDDIVEVQSKNELLLLSNDRKENWKDLLVKLTNESFHAMNKKAILRHTDKFIETYL